MLTRAARAAERLAAWADEKLLKNVLIGLLLIDAGTGLVWMLSADRSFASPVYDPAKMLLPMHWHGALFLLFAVAAWGSWLSIGRGFRTGWLVGGLLMGLWLFWVVLFTSGAYGRPGATYLGTAYAAGMTFLHAVTGLALSHRRAPLPSTTRS